MEEEEVDKQEEPSVAFIMMSCKVKKIKKHDPLPLVLPTLNYVWTDMRERRICVMEFHLPLGTIPDEYEMTLIEREGKQYFQCFHIL